MEALEAVLTRRSIRRYTDEPVSDGDVQDLLRAAMAAPSADNEQPWHFVVIRDRNTMEEITRFHPFSRMLHHAKVAILVCADSTRDKLNGMFVQDCAAATENILIAAHAKGLGAVWLGIYPREDRFIRLRQMLQIPAHVFPFSLVAIGHPEETKPASNRFDSGRVHHERWGLQG